MWNLFKDMFKGQAFPNFPLSLKVKNFKNFETNIQSQNSNFQYLDTGDSTPKAILNFKLSKKYSFFDYYNFPTYHFQGKVLKNNGPLKLEGEFVERGLSKPIQWLAFFYIFLFLIGLIFSVIYLFKRGVEENTYILLLINFFFFLMIFLLALIISYLRKIGTKRIQEIRNFIIEASLS